MKKIYTLCLGILIGINTYSQYELEWQKCLGGSDIEKAYSIGQTLDGGYILTGHGMSTDGDVSYNNGSRDYWVVKLDNLGNIQWERSYGGSGDEWSKSIIQTFDGGYIVAGYSNSTDGDVTGNHGMNDYWILKTDSIGNIEWQKSFGGSMNDEAYSIIQSSDGGYVVAGWSHSNDGDVTGNHGDSDLWIVKIDSLGNLLWQNCFGSSGQDHARSVKETIDGGYVIVGNAHLNNGNVSSVYGMGDFWIIKISSSGNLIWQKAYGGTSIDRAFDVEITLDDGFLLTGHTQSDDGYVAGCHLGTDVWVVKLDSIGNFQWQKCLGGNSSDESYCASVLSNGNYLLAGNVYSNDGDVSGNHGTCDVWLVLLDNTGNIIWSKTFGGSSVDEVYDIKNTIDGGIIIAGTTASNDGDVSGVHGSADFWIVKFTTIFNVINGTIFLDLNNNTLQDIGEASLINKTITENNTGRFAISDINGFYDISVLDTGNFSVSPSPLLHYTAVPASHSAYFSAMNQTDSLNNFAFQPNGVINDLQVTINPVGAFRPGFDAHYNIHYKNVGTTSISGSIILKLDNVLNYISSLTTPTSVTSDSVVWNIATLNPFDEGNILVTVNVSTIAVIGSTVNSIARIEPVAGDAIPADNESNWPVIVTGSYDPNDILVNRETVTTTELISPPYLDYLIRFQNTGTDTAFTVKIKNPLPVNAQLNTFEFLESSHHVQLNYSNPEQLMWFQFDNILLPDSNTNELLSHGYVRYRIKPKSTLVVGELIENSASIFFDFNAPIYTNTAVTEIVLPSSVPGIRNNFDFSIYPNPSTGEVNISFTLKEEKKIKIELYNSLGQILKTISEQKFTSGKNQINFSTENLSKGIYHVKFSVGDNVVTRKLVKM